MPLQCAKCGKLNGDAVKFCGTCGNSFIGRDTTGGVTAITVTLKIMEERSFGWVAIISLITCFIYPGFFYRKLAQDINMMCAYKVDTVNYKEAINLYEQHEYQHYN